MSAAAYYQSIAALLARIHETQAEAIGKAGAAIAEAIANRGRAYLFGSGHSVIPVMDAFPRYGSFIGFFPLYDPRLMWTSVVGGGGVRELLWIERREGYIEQFLRSYPIESRDVMVVFSHGGLNAAPIEAAIYAKNKGALVITVSSLANAAFRAATHTSGKKLSDLADIAIDNCTAPEDAQVDIGRPEKIAAGSTVAAVFIAMSLVAESGALLAARGIHPPTFVSPNVPGIDPDHNLRVYDAFGRTMSERR